MCYLLCENGGRASIQRVQSANSTEPESAIAATRPPVPQPLFSGSPNYAGRGSVPKCVEPGVPKVNATLENLTEVPPVMSTSNGVGEMGAGLPLRVTVAVPFTRNPPVIGVTSALSMVMW